MSSSGKTDSRKHKKKDKKKEHHKSSKDHHKKDSKKKHKDKDKDKGRDKDRDKERSHRDKDHRSHDKHKTSSEVAQISEDDYFLKNEEFRVWLHVNRNTPFETLTTVQAREMFAGDFRKSWNKGGLASMFYEGTIPTELRHQCVKTSHKWGLKLSANEKEQVSDLAYRVDTSTRKQFQNAWNHMAKDDKREDPSASSSIKPFSSLSSSSSNSSSGGKLVDQREKRSYNHGDEQARREEQLKEEKSDRKRQRYYEREKASVIMDEIAPKATGREAQIDKKREAGAKLQGAAADREAGRDGLELSEAITMGGGDDFASVKARREKGKQRRVDQKQDRIRELQDKEKDKTQNFMNQLGIDFSKGPIKIQPR